MSTSTPSTVDFRFGRYDQFHFIHHGQLIPHPEDPNQMVHACRVCGDPVTGRRSYYCSSECADHWLYNIYLPCYWGYWRKRALERDGYACTECGATHTHSDWGRLLPLEVHHIEPVKLNPNREFDLDNLVTLCRPCHNDQPSVQELQTRDNHKTLDTFQEGTSA